MATYDMMEQLELIDDQIKRTKKALNDCNTFEQQNDLTEMLDHLKKWQNRYNSRLC